MFSSDRQRKAMFCNIFGNQNRTPPLSKVALKSAENLLFYPGATEGNLLHVFDKDMKDFNDGKIFKSAFVEKKDNKFSYLNVNRKRRIPIEETRNLNIDDAFDDSVNDNLFEDDIFIQATIPDPQEFLTKEESYISNDGEIIYHTSPKREIKVKEPIKLFDLNLERKNASKLRDEYLRRKIDKENLEFNSDKQRKAMFADFDDSKIVENEELEGSSLPINITDNSSNISTSLNYNANKWREKFSKIQTQRMHIKSIGPREVEIDIDGSKKIADDDNFEKVVNAISPDQRVQLIDGYKLNEADLRIYKDRIKHIYDGIEV